jgi:hypothetical protein
MGLEKAAIMRLVRVLAVGSHLISALNCPYQPENPIGENHENPESDLHSSNSFPGA